MSFRLALTICCAATMFCAPLAAQNSRINENGQQQMNDAAPVNGSGLETQGNTLQPSDLRMFPKSRSPDGAATGASTGESGSDDDYQGADRD